MNPEYSEMINSYFELWLTYYSIPTIFVFFIGFVIAIDYAHKARAKTRKEYQHLFKEKV